MNDEQNPQPQRGCGAVLHEVFLTEANEGNEGLVTDTGLSSLPLVRSGKNDLVKLSIACRNSGVAAGDRNTRRFLTEANKGNEG